MSESYRERLRLRIKEPKLQKSLANFGMTEKELVDFIEKHIEELCSESDRQCKEIDQVKAVDQIIDEMSDDRFDNFTKNVILSVKSRINKLKRKWKPSDEEDDLLYNEAKPVPQKEEELMARW